MTTSFTNQKRLRFIMTLGTGAFGSSTANQITLEGFRASADIDKAGGMQMGTLRAQIYGVSQSNMNSVTTFQWQPRSQFPNTVQVIAIDGTQETVVFYGNIVNAWANYQSMPDVFLHIQAQSAYAAQLNSVSPRSFNGQIDVATVIDGIAKSIGMTVEKNGVSVQMAFPYLPNTALEQIKKIAHDAHIGLYVDDNVIALTPDPYAPRTMSQIPLVSAATGLKDYPSFDGIGVNFTTLFNPAIRFGGSVELVSDYAPASGQWIVVCISHRLSSEKPGGPWYSTIRGNRNGLAVVAS